MKQFKKYPRHSIMTATTSDDKNYFSQISASYQSYLDDYGYITDEAKRDLMYNMNFEELDDVMHSVNYDYFYKFAWLTSQNPNLSEATGAYILDRLSSNPWQFGYVASHMKQTGTLTPKLVRYIQECAHKFSTYSKSWLKSHLDYIDEWVDNLKICCPGSDKEIGQLQTLKQSLMKWPSASRWRRADVDEFEALWSTYLSDPENEVNQELGIVLEGSLQGGSGAISIIDQSDSDNEVIGVDYDEWTDNEINMAATSKNKEQYKQKYRAYVESLISQWWA